MDNANDLFPHLLTHAIMLGVVFRTQYHDQIRRFCANLSDKGFDGVVFRC
jgi:diacylglycerol kinase family enzyme